MKNILHLPRTKENQIQYEQCTQKIKSLITNTTHKETTILNEKVLLKEQLGTPTHPKLFKINLKEIQLSPKTVGADKPYQPKSQYMIDCLDKALKQVNIRRSYLSAQHQQLETHLENILPNQQHNRKKIATLADVNQINISQKMTNNKNQTRLAQIGILTRKIAAICE